MQKNKKFIPVNTPLIDNSDIKAVSESIKSGWISSEGPNVKLFEEKMAKYLDRKYGCAVSSGTAALEIAIKSLNLKKNDEVLLPSFTIISNANAIIKNSLKPVLIDVDIKTWNIIIDDIEKKITKKTKCLMLPHIYGLSNDMNKILKIVKKYNLYLIEDAAEVLGLKYKSKFCGSFGDISVLSFYANKHITTGEGGMLLTNNYNLNRKFKDYRNLCFGSKSNRFNHYDIGWNYRYTNIQATLGLNQLKRVNQIIKKKLFIGNYYYNHFKNLKNIILQPNKLPYSKNIYWIFGIVIKKQSKLKCNEIVKKLFNKNIGTRPFFWPIHKQDAYREKKYFKKLSLPNSEYIAKNGFYLPSGLGLSLKELKYVKDTVIDILS
ncbi:DegT/DnrJ/EryC1/StrS aminotransferase family protein [Candidatus Pelagibacter sp.]|nr:DegT/DnrJ/EryC1/StrS aminotransferase family protein [Candidatus Pelagibacter sp.]